MAGVRGWYGRYVLHDLSFRTRLGRRELIRLPCRIRLVLLIGICAIASGDSRTDKGGEREEAQGMD